MIPLYNVDIKEGGRKDLIYQDRRIEPALEPYSKLFNPDFLPREMNILFEDHQDHFSIDVRYRIAKSDTWLNKLSKRDSVGLYYYLGIFNYMIFPTRIMELTEILDTIRAPPGKQETEQQCMNRIFRRTIKHYKIIGPPFKPYGPWAFHPCTPPQYLEAIASASFEKQKAETESLDTIVEKFKVLIPQIFRLNAKLDKITSNKSSRND